MTTTAASQLLAVEGLSVFYDKFRAIDHVDISVGAGEIVSIIGANGAGKSTLLKAIIGQADRVEGTISFRRQRHRRPQPPRRSWLRGIMLVPEGRRLFPSLTVEENLRLGWEVGRKGEIGFADRLATISDAGGKATAESRIAVRRTAADGRARPGAARQSAAAALRRDQPRSGADDRQRTLRDHSRHQARAASAFVIVEQDIARSLAVADRFYCLLEGNVTLAGRPGRGQPRLRHAALFRLVTTNDRRPGSINYVQGVLLGGLYTLFATGLSLSRRRHALRQHRPRRLHRSSLLRAADADDNARPRSRRRHDRRAADRLRHRFRPAAVSACSALSAKTCCWSSSSRSGSRSSSRTACWRTLAPTRKKSLAAGWKRRRSRSAPASMWACFPPSPLPRRCSSAWPSRSVPLPHRHRRENPRRR